ncbi:MAG: transcription termination factor Rho, partial [Anaerolineae bacterium]
MDIAELERMTLVELRTIAREAEIAGYSRLKKEELILRILRDTAEKQGHQLRGG